MTINTTWKIDNIECLTQSGEHTDVVYVVHWRLHASDGTAQTSIYSSCLIDLAPEGTFIPFNELTEETVIGWVHASLGEEGVARSETSVVAALEEILAPMVVSKPLPWA
jgi:hypothetical protein